jgi:drug/metabolite transporter (DMT)-like permease
MTASKRTNLVEFLPQPSRPYVRLIQSRLAEIAVFTSVLCAACGHIMIKYGLNAMPSIVDEPFVTRLMTYMFAPRVVLGLLIYGVGTLLWIVAVAKRDISYVYPISALNYVIVVMAGKWVLGESISTGRWLGVLVVMVGVAVLQTSKKDKAK